MPSLIDPSGCQFTAGILVKEAPNSSSELQIKLQAKCQKLRLVSKLPNKADLLLPIEGGTIAMRFYDSSRIKQLQSLEEFNLVQSKFNDFKSIQQDLDLVLKFQNGNKHSVIFFLLLSKKEMDDQLSTNDSVFHVIQHVVRMGVDQDSSTKVKGCSRILFVHDYNELISQLYGIKEALLPDKVEKKGKLFEVEAKKNLVQDGHAIKFDENNEYVKERVKEALQNWALRKGLDVDAVLVVLQHLESLEHVVGCTADVLKRIPVDESIKLEILKFFGPILSQSTNSTDIDNNVHSRNAQGSDMDGNMMNGQGVSQNQNQGEDFNFANIHQTTTRMPLKNTNRSFHHMEQMDMDMTCQPSEDERHNSDNHFDFVKTPTQYREHCNFRPPFKSPNVLHTTIDQPITYGERPYVNLLQRNTQMYNDNGPDLYLVDHPPPYGSNQLSQGLFSSRGGTAGSQHRNFQPQQSYAYQNPHGSVRNVETHDEQGNHIAHYIDQIGPKRFSPYRR